MGLNLMSQFWWVHWGNVRKFHTYFNICIQLTIWRFFSYASAPIEGVNTIFCKTAVKFGIEKISVTNFITFHCKLVTYIALKIDLVGFISKSNMRFLFSCLNKFIDFESKRVDTFISQGDTILSPLINLKLLVKLLALNLSSSSQNRDCPKISAEIYSDWALSVNAHSDQLDCSWHRSIPLLHYIYPTIFRIHRIYCCESVYIFTLLTLMPAFHAVPTSK